MMKRIFFFLMLGFLAMAAIAQPPARLREAKKTTTAVTPPVSVPAKSNLTSSAIRKPVSMKSVPTVSRAELDFPTAEEMPEDVSWRRDIYRVLDLTKDQNAVLYYPEEPQGDRMNLFTYLFKLMLRKQITVYNYTIDGNEDFSSENAVVPKKFLENNHIRFEERLGKFRIDDSDIPSSEVKNFYIKESSYYDQHTATFHTQVVAICPVRVEMDEFGSMPIKTPLFWVKYADVAPYLAKLSLNCSNYNNAAVVSGDDYFTTNLYDGTIYKTNNLQGKVLANYCQTDSALNVEQDRIEKELSDFQNHVWGKDSTMIKEQAKQDSIAQAQQAVSVNKDKKETAKESTKVAKKEETSSKSSRSQSKRQKSTATTYSVRKQRH